MLQAFPHAPQLEVVVVEVSQPLDGLASQFAKPALQVTPQVPDEQVAVPFVASQTFPQAPQLVVSLPSATSQPSATLPLQLAKPGVQAMLQLPEGQLGVPFAELHAVPQAPQFVTVYVFVSQPFASLPSQLAKPGLQVMPLQTPPEQVGVPPEELQTFPQMPQLEVVPRFVSQPSARFPLQLPHPGLHAIVQAVPSHPGMPFTVLQTVPQTPQLVTLERFVSQPLTALPSQFANPGVQVMAHEPEAQDGVPFVELQAIPHPPQCAVLTLTFVSHPVVMSASQLPKPVVHAMPQSPPVHDGVPLFALQALPQAPQCEVVEATFVSQPVAALPSQSP